MWLALWQPASITMDGLTVNITNGYPALGTIDDTSRRPDRLHVAATATATTFTKTGATTPATCVCRVHAIGGRRRCADDCNDRRRLLIESQHRLTGRPGTGRPVTS